MQQTEIAKFIQQIDFQTITSTENSIEKLRINQENVELVLTQIYQQSSVAALRFSKAIIRLSIANEKQPNFQLFLALVNTGCGEAANKVEIRNIVCTACCHSKVNMSLMLIHAISHMDQTNARAYMKSYIDIANNCEYFVLEWWRVVRKMEPNGTVIQRANDTKGARVLGRFIEDIDMNDARVMGGLGFIVDIVEDILSPPKKLIKTIADAFKDATNDLSGLLENLAERTLGEVANVVQDLLETGVESVGTILDSALAAGEIAFKKIVKGLDVVTKLVKEVVKWSAYQTVDTIISICLEVSDGFRKSFLKGILKLLSTPIKLLEGAFVVSLSTGLLVLTAILEFAGEYRSLNPKERAAAEKIFGSSIDLDRVRISISDTMADIVKWINNNRPFTTMYLIHFASEQDITMGTLIHELTHVWQSQKYGPIYMINALISQHFGRAYNVTNKDLAQAAGDLGKLEMEQQAVVVELYWECLSNDLSTQDCTDYETLAKQVFKNIPTRKRGNRQNRTHIPPGWPFHPGKRIP